MKDADRVKRNTLKLSECHPAFRVRLEHLLVEMSSLGFKPRIQEAWRNPADELKAFNEGKSQVKRGFHSITSATGTKEALAADVIDDVKLFDCVSSYVYTLAWCAMKVGLQTGFAWGLKQVVRDAQKSHLKDGPPFPDGLPFGWDPYHVEVTGMTITQAISGARPEPWSPPTTEVPHV